MFSVLIHIANEDPVFAEVDELPKMADSLIMVRNPRKRDGKDLHYLVPGVTQVIWPLTKVAFIEIMPNEEEEEIIGFVRE